MHLEDEIEFFEFDPYDFLQKLPDALEESVKSTLDGIKIAEKVKRELLAHFNDSLRKNYILFEDFCIPQIFTFPSDFVYERKVTDGKISREPESITQNISKLKDELDFHQSEIKRIKELNEQKKNEKNELEKLIEHRDLQELISNAEFLKKLHKKTKHALGENAGNVPRQLSSQFTALLENKEIKTEMKKKEINELLKIGSIDDIDAFRKNFHAAQNYGKDQ